MSIEHRREERLMTPDLSRGELFHPGSGQCFKVESVRDVSIQGIGLNVGGSLDQGEKVRMAFDRGKAHMELYGRVVWCAPLAADEKTSSFMMGIII